MSANMSNVVPEPGGTLWMGDLEPYMDEFFILRAFDQMGETATTVKLINNKFSGLPAGYCFVDFPDRESAQRAMLRLNGKIIPNSIPTHRFKLNHNNAKENKKEFSLFVGELTEEVDDYLLFRAFNKRYPSCYSAKVVLDNRGQCKGFGFIRFTTETDQQKALIEMQHQTGIGRHPIRVSMATPKRPFVSSSSSSSGPDTSQPPPAMNNSQGGHQNYYSAYKAYDDYLRQYNQYCANYYATASNTAQQTPPTGTYTAAPAGTEDSSLDIEEPELTIDVAKSNREYMAQSEEIFDILEDSRWHPMDQWSTNVPATAR